MPYNGCMEITRHVRGMIHLIGWVFVAVCVVWSLTACDPTKGRPSGKSSASPAVVIPLPNRPTPTGGKQNPSPGKDPNPQAYAAMPITAECGWTGYRWITMLVTVNLEPLAGHPREFNYDEDGETARSQTFEAHPGDALTLDCKPMPDERRDQAIQCKLTWFTTVLQPGGYQRKQGGEARCYAQLPRRA